jgi:hypothetical protein
MGHVQDSPVSNNMISNDCMIYHIKVHTVGYNLGQFFFLSPKFIFCPFMDKPAIVNSRKKHAVTSRRLQLTKKFPNNSPFFQIKGSKAVSQIKITNLVYCVTGKAA